MQMLLREWMMACPNVRASTACYRLVSSKGQSRFSDRGLEIEAIDRSMGAEPQLEY